MFTPNTTDFESLAFVVEQEDEDGIHVLIQSWGLPEECAAHLYAYCVEYKGECTADSMRKLFNKAWA